MKILIGVLMCVWLTAAMPVVPDLETGKQPATEINEDTAREFLAKYGYIKKDNMLESESLEAGLRLYQNFNKLEDTGTLDEATTDLMKIPRCGTPDFEESADLAEVNLNKRWNTFGPRWTTATLTYKINNYQNPSILTADTQRATIQWALATWAAASPVTRFVFNEVPWNWGSNINFGFFSGNHDPNPPDSPFDGPGGTLAHAFPPPDGRVHFDSTENLVPSGWPGISFESLALHELGHTMGIAHSPFPDAIMYASHNGMTRLSPDDIGALRYLYG